MAWESEGSSLAERSGWRRLLWLVAERVGEALREGGLLVAVFGLLDYYLGQSRQDEAWPWKCSAVGAILWVSGLVVEWGQAEVKRWIARST